MNDEPWVALPEHVDAVLGGLGHAEPGPGMEARVLGRLATAQEAGSTATIRRGAGWRWAFVIMVGCVLYRGLMWRPQTMPFQTAQTRRTVVKPGAAHTVGHQPGAETLRNDNPGHRRSATRPPEARAPEQDGGTASFPAPPMPLTEQERLLVELASDQEPAQLALLNAHERNAQAAENAARFEAFFRPVARERPVLITEIKPPVQPAGRQEQRNPERTRR